MYKIDLPISSGQIYLTYLVRSCLNASGVAYGIFVTGSKYLAGRPVMTHIAWFGSDVNVNY